MLSEINGCIVVPTYNNEKTVEDVLNRILRVVPNATVIVVNDGSTNSTVSILESFGNRIVLLTNERNMGKGFSLRRGFKTAIELGFDNVISIDSDGQHFPEDIPIIVEKSKEHPGAVIMGSRNMQQEGVPGKSSFGNKFSNFWFKLETGISLPDTQTGFRLYPLERIRKMTFFTRKFEFEIEVIVRLAWKGVKFYPVGIRVLYDMDERVSHFRPGRDFFRISVLNSILVIGALLYYYPKRLRSYDTFHTIKMEAIKPKESNLSKALSLGFGCFMGIVPIWGFQLLVGIPLAVLFRMNKVLFIAAANISIPPMIPFILYASLIMGQFIVGGEIDHAALVSTEIEDMKANAYQYVVGALLLAVLSFFTVFLLSFTLLSLFRKKRISDF